MVYEFAPASGPHAAAAFDRLRGIWARCRDVLSMASPIPERDYPANLPVSALDIPGEGVLAAQEHSSGGPEGGVHQAVLRREHDLLCLSVVMSPVATVDGSGNGDFSWTRLDERWNSVAADLPAVMVGAARVWQGHLRGAEATSGSLGSAPARFARLCRGALPPGPRTPGWEQRGIGTRHGLAIWEPYTVEDDRAERQLVVIAEENQDWELSTYTWTRDDLAMPALQRYLAQAAKIRYQRRVWAGGDQVRDLIAQSRVRANELVRWVEAGPPSPGLSRPSPPFARHSSDPAARVRHLHADFLRLVSASSELAAISHSVEIAESNMRAILREDVDKTTQHDPFADDLELAGHFIVEIADDLTYLEAATTHARETLVAVERAVLGWPQITALEGIGAGSARSPANGTVHTDSGHTDARARICDAMSGLFATITDRSQLLARIGIPRHRLPEIQAGNSWQWWWEVLEELDKGLVVDPYPRLIAAARATYPGNHLLAQLAAEHGLDGTFGE